MTSYYFGINRGDPMYKAAVATSTTGKDIEVVVNGTNVPDRQSVLTALENIETFMLQNSWTPL